MSGYLRATARKWEAEHWSRSAWLGRAKCAPDWWIDLDVAWHVDRRELPSAREAGEHWGVHRNTAARHIRACVEAQAAWEARSERKAAILSLLKEWAAKEPKSATAARRGTREGQGRTEYTDSRGTGDHGTTPASGERARQERDARGTREGQGRDASRTSSLDQPPTVQPPADLPPHPPLGGERELPDPPPPASGPDAARPPQGSRQEVPQQEPDPHAATGPAGGDPCFRAEPVLVDGRPVPATLEALGIPAALARKLRVEAGIESPLELLRYPDDPEGELRYLDGVGLSRFRQLRKACVRSGFPLGSVPPETGPPEPDPFDDLPLPAHVQNRNPTVPP